MAVITLISDQGNRDYYVASVKGAILSQHPAAVIIDITHQLPAFDIAQASFNLKNVYRDFPPGSIHLIGLSNAEKGSVYLAVQYDGHYFLGEDSGIFSLIFDKKPDKIVEIQMDNNTDSLLFPVRDILGRAAGYLSSGGQLDVLGPKRDSFSTRVLFQPVVTGNEIRGTVIYIDVYGNVFTNIVKELFLTVGNNRPFSIFFAAANYPIRKISNHYSDVPEGERLALFGSSGHLQLAINRGINGAGGGASQLFGLKLNHSVRVDFEN